VAGVSTSGFDDLCAREVAGPTERQIAEANGAGTGTEIEDRHPAGAGRRCRRLGQRLTCDAGGVEGVGLPSRLPSTPPRGSSTVTDTVLRCGSAPAAFPVAAATRFVVRCPIDGSAHQLDASWRDRSTHPRRVCTPLVSSLAGPEGMG
jgi:hypothetical protein